MIWGLSPAAQWLKLCLLMQGAQVQSLVRELRSHIPQSAVKEKKVFVVDFEC